MSFTAIASKLLKLSSRRGGGVSSYFSGDITSIEQLAADVMAVAGVTGRAGYLAAIEAVADALSAAGIVSGGATALVVQSLYTGINNGVSFSDDHGGNACSWKTDEAEGYAEIIWTAGGTAGLRLNIADNTQRGIYVSCYVRRNSSALTKCIKLFGKGYTSGGNYSNMNFSAFDSGTLMGFGYSDDATVGGDVSVQFTCGGYPTNNLPSLYYGTAFSRSPYPTQQSTHAFNFPIDGTWHRLELWCCKDSGITNDGEVAVRFDSNNSTVAYFKNMWNRCSNSIGWDMLGLGEYAPTPGVVEHYKKFDQGHSRPTTWGI